MVAHGNQFLQALKSLLLQLIPDGQSAETWLNHAPPPSLGLISRT